MTARKRGRPRKEVAPNHIQITGKRVQGDDGKKHLRGERLVVGQDVTVETAAKMIEFGTAVVLDGQTMEATQDEIRKQEAAKLIRLHKQRADWEMEQFDRQTRATRDRINYSADGRGGDGDEQEII